MKHTQVIILESDNQVGDAIEAICEPLFENIDRSTDEAQAVDKLAQKHYGIAIVDISLQDNFGFKLYDYILKAHKMTLVILRCRQPEVMEAIAATRAGCFAFFQQTSMSIQLPALLNAAANIDEHRSGNSWRNLMIHRSAIIDTHLDHIGHCAQSELPVAITGPSGSGKRLTAELIHLASPRANEAFAVFDCRKKAPEQITKELFGYVSSTYAGNSEDKVGIFKRAEGGSVLLHHIDTLDMSVQLELLSVLRARQFRAVGSDRTNLINVRLLASSDRNLESEMMTGGFSESLYYHLQAMQVNVPELAEHAEDIPLLAKYRNSRAAKALNKVAKPLSSGAIQLLTETAWPGNIRQLFDFIDKLVEEYNGQGSIPASEIEDRLLDTPRSIPTFQQARAEFEREYLIQILLVTEGNITQAARIADRNRTDFYKLLKRNNLEPSHFKNRPPVIKRGGKRGPLPRPRLKAV